MSSVDNVTKYGRRDDVEVIIIREHVHGTEIILYYMEIQGVCFVLPKSL